MNRFLARIVSIGFLLCVLPGTVDAADKLDELRKERSAISRAIRRAVPDPAAADPELAKLQRASLDAQKVYLQALDAHSSLKGVNAELRQANDALARAVATNDAAGRENAQKRMTSLQHRRTEEAAKIPELAKLAKANDDAGGAYFAREKTYLAAHPATKDLVIRLAKVNEQILAERKAR